MENKEKVIEETNVDETPKSTGGKIWAFLKKWGLVGIIGAALVSGGTWLFTTMDNLKDKNIQLETRMESYEAIREAQWKRLYHFDTVQMENTVEIEVNKRLYNILVYSEKIDPNELPELKIEKNLRRSKSFEDFKKDSIIEQNQKK